VRRFPQNVGDYFLRIPHIGWGKVKLVKPSPLTNSLAENSRFYFVHSYYVECTDRSSVLLESEYGIPFDSAISLDNVYGVQFHPEKSHDFGLELLRSFAQLTKTSFANEVH
jgi:glutamine amidotransferase